jgi:hypothetical protein
MCSDHDTGPVQSLEYFMLNSPLLNFLCPDQKFTSKPAQNVVRQSFIFILHWINIHTFNLFEHIVLISCYNYYTSCLENILQEDILQWRLSAQGCMIFPDHQASLYGDQTWCLIHDAHLRIHIILRYKIIVFTF